MTIKTVKDAINDALVQSFEEDKNVILMGEDIAGGKGREQYQGTQAVSYTHLRAHETG